MASAPGSRATLARKLRPKSNIGESRACGKSAGYGRSRDDKPLPPADKPPMGCVRCLPPRRKQRRREIRGRATVPLARLIVRMRIGVRFDRPAIEVPSGMAKYRHHHRQAEEERDRAEDQQRG